MANSTTSNPFPGAIFTIPYNHAETISTNPASASSSHSILPPNNHSSGISLKSLKAIWTTISDPTPASVASSAVPTVLSTETNTEVEDADPDDDEQSARPPSDSPLDASSAPTAACTKSQAEKKNLRSRRKDFGGPTNTISRFNKGSVGASSASLAQTLAPVYRPRGTDSGRVKALLGASGLSIRTRGLQGRSTSSCVFQLGGDSGGSDGGCQMENGVEGIEVLNQPRWVWEAWA